jgi:hypothetical protein
VLARAIAELGDALGLDASLDELRGQVERLLVSYG